MIDFKKIDPFTYVVIGSGAVITLLVVYLGGLAVKNNLITLPQKGLSFFGGKSVTLNPNALYFTNPVMSFSSAKVTGKSNDAIWVEVTTYPTTTLLMAAPAMTTGAQAPTPPEAKKLNFKILVTDSTTITKPAVFVPYAFKQQTPLTVAAPATTQTQRLTINDLSDGEFVDIFLAEDFRFAKGNTLKASSITKRVNSNTFSGPIESISGSTLKTKAVIMASGAIAMPAAFTTPPAPKTYTITITGDTEIVTYGQTGPKAINLDALKAGANITVYSASPIDDTNFTAAKIDLAPSMPVAPALPATAPNGRTLLPATP